MEPRVIFEDSDILVLDKPSGMIVNRSDTTAGERTVQEWIETRLVIPNSRLCHAEFISASEILKNEIPEMNSGQALKQVQDDTKRIVQHDTNESDFYNRAGIVHRLDKETSGILIVAKNPQAFENLQKQFKERKVKKTYVALVHGKVEPQIGEINVSVGRLPWNRKRFGVVVGGREAVTKYKVIQNSEFRIQNEKLTLLELYPETGRTHQIRVHLKYFNRPIFADSLYGGRKTARNDRKLLPRIFLHASKISFCHPRTNQVVSFESQLSYELSHFLSSLNS